MENTNEVVNPELTTQQPVKSPSALEDLEQKKDKTEKEDQFDLEKVPVVEEEPKPQPGDKTPPNLLLKSLQEEKEKRRELENELKEAKEQLNTLSSINTSDEEVFSDEGKALQKQVKDLESQLAEIKTEKAKNDLLKSFPVLSEHLKEFEEYQELPENSGMSMTVAAKSFLVENGLLDTTRKGLEKPVGGDRVPTSSGKMTAEEAEKLRKTNFRKYQDMLQKGQIPDKLG